MVYLFLADGFEEIEALTQVDYLRRAGIEIKTLGIGKEYVTGTRKITVKADMLIDDADPAGFDALILPGGLGGVNGISESSKAKEMIKSAHKSGKLICAICAAPTILAGMGILSGKKCICYPSMTDVLKKNGGIVTDSAVVCDGRIITAKAAGASEQFSFEIINAIKGADAAEKVRLDICARGRNFKKSYPHARYGKQKIFSAHFTVKSAMR